MNVYEETQLILHKYKIQANKSLGQNFLVDDNVIDEIIRSSNIDKQDLIIEIGPGLGVLTNRLLQEANNVIAVELDKRMVNILQDRFILNINGQAESKLEIINEDILKINLNEIIAEKRKQTERQTHSKRNQNMWGEMMTVTMSICTFMSKSKDAVTI